jgi:hypothetical protein
MNRYRRYGYNNHPGKSLLIFLLVAGWPLWGVMFLMMILGF